MSILEYNGSAIVAMTGKNCVAIASDKRFGIRQQTVDMNMKKSFKINDKCFLGLSGLATDVQTVYVFFTSIYTRTSFEKLQFRTNMYKLKEERDIKPSSFANMVSNFLYERRYDFFPNFNG